MSLAGSLPSPLDQQGLPSESQKPYVVKTKMKARRQDDKNESERSRKMKSSPVNFEQKCISWFRLTSSVSNIVRLEEKGEGSGCFSSQGLSTDERSRSSTLSWPMSHGQLLVSGRIVTKMLKGKEGFCEPLMC